MEKYAKLFSEQIKRGKEIRKVGCEEKKDDPKIVDPKIVDPKIVDPKSAIRVDK